MKKFLGVIFMFILSGCTKFSDSDITLATTSLLGATVHLATFNGDSASKSEDCQLIASVLNQAYPSRSYVCLTYKELKKRQE